MANNKFLEETGLSRFWAHTKKLVDDRFKQFEGYHPNLVINGDFQINQRGKSEYGENGYTLDMWNCILTNGNKLSQLPSGYGVLINKVKANQTVLRQRNPNVSKYPVGTKFTAVMILKVTFHFQTKSDLGNKEKYTSRSKKKTIFIYLDFTI